MREQNRHCIYPVTRRGFSAVELAVVIAIIGIVLGGIWVFASSSSEHARQQQLTERLSLVVKAVRAYYTAQAGISEPGAALTLMPQLISKGVTPSIVMRPGASPANGCINPLCADNPWGPGGNAAAAYAQGSLRVCAWTLGVPAAADSSCVNGGGALSQYFAVEIMGLNPGSCIAAVAQNSASSGPPGLADVVVNGTSVMNAGSPVTHSLPVQAADAIVLCTGAPTSANTAMTIDFIYRLRPPTF